MTLEAPSIGKECKPIGKSIGRSPEAGYLLSFAPPLYRRCKSDNDAKKRYIIEKSGDTKSANKEGKRRPRKGNRVIVIHHIQ